MSWLQFHGKSLLDTVGVYPVEWWLVYSKTDSPHWWNFWIDKELQHVFAMRRDGAIWIKFSPHCEFLDIDILRTDATPWQLFPGHKIQRVAMLRNGGILRSPWHTGPITCVEFVKALLGIRCWWVRTPRQLYEYCLRGEQVWVKVQSNRRQARKRSTCGSARRRSLLDWMRRRTSASKA